MLKMSNKKVIVVISSLISLRQKPAGGDYRVEPFSNNRRSGCCGYIGYGCYSGYGGYSVVEVEHHHVVHACISCDLNHNMLKP